VTAACPRAASGVSDCCAPGSPEGARLQRRRTPRIARADRPFLAALGSRSSGRDLIEGLTKANIVKDLFEALGRRRGWVRGDPRQAELHWRADRAYSDRLRPRRRVAASRLGRSARGAAGAELGRGPRGAGARVRRSTQEPGPGGGALLALGSRRPERIEEAIAACPRASAAAPTRRSGSAARASSPATPPTPRRYRGGRSTRPRSAARCSAPEAAIRVLTAWRLTDTSSRSRARRTRPRGPLGCGPPVDQLISYDNNEAPHRCFSTRLERYSPRRAPA